MNQNIKNIFSNIRSVFVKSEAEQEIVRSIRELRRYSDAELRDLGISRLSIEESVRGESANDHQKAA